MASTKTRLPRLDATREARLRDILIDMAISQPSGKVFDRAEMELLYEDVRQLLGEIDHLRAGGLPLTACCEECGTAPVITAGPVNDIVCTHVSPACACDKGFNLWPAYGAKPATGPSERLARLNALLGPSPIDALQSAFIAGMDKCREIKEAYGSWPTLPGRLELAQDAFPADESFVDSAATNPITSGTTDSNAGGVSL